MIQKVPGERGVNRRPQKKKKNKQITETHHISEALAPTQSQTEKKLKMGKKRGGKGGGGELLH